MATTPQFSSAPIVGSAVLSATADTSYTAPTHTVSLVTATGARVITGSVATGSATLTSSTLQNGDVGRPASGAGIPTGTIVLSVVPATSGVMSAKATATHTNEAVTLGGGAGLKIEEVDAVGTTTTVAGLVNFFLKDAATAYHFIATLIVPVVTPSTSVAPYGATPAVAQGKWRPTNLWLPPNWSLVATSFTASQKINCVAYAGAY